MLCLAHMLGVMPLIPLVAGGRSPCGVRELAPAVCRPGLPGRAPDPCHARSSPTVREAIPRAVSAVRFALIVTVSGVSRAFSFARSAGTRSRRTSLRCGRVHP